VDAIATYSDLVYRRPVGKRVMLLCDSVSCWITGCEGIAAHLKARLGTGPGETSADGRFTLIPVGCLGACELAPVMMMDGELYGNLTPERVDRILEDPERGAGKPGP
jgi:NADH-quinone oxidoreductase subunit E